MPLPTPVRDTYRLGATPEDYRPGWLRAQLANIARVLWFPISRTALSGTTVTATDFLILADASGGAFTVTFPLPAQMQFAYVTVKRLNSGANAVTLGGTFDGVVNPTLASQYSAKTVFSDGSAWYTLATV